MYGICNLSIVPCRSEPSNKSEMVTQLLFGEHFKILETQNNWAYIETAYDHYPGWIDSRQYLPISQESFCELQEIPLTLALDLVQVVHNRQTNVIMPILLGSSLPFYDAETCNLEGHEYSYEGQFLAINKTLSRVKLIENAFTYIDAPYLWGGRSPFGIDCSGFTQTIYKINGIKLPRDAYQQATVGQTLSFVEEAEEGDLAFFDNEDGRIVHVGIIMRNNQIIHASGKVRIDKLDHHGIFNPDTQRYTHRLRLIKKVF